MATRKDFVALEQAIAAANVTIAQTAIDSPDMSTNDFAVFATNMMTMAIIEELQRVNPAFDSDMFVDEIKKYMEVLNGQTAAGDRDIPSGAQLTHPD